MIVSAAYRRERDDLLAQIVAALETDNRVVAAWLGGSLGGGTADDLSDLDLWVVVEDDRIREIAVDPVAFVHAIAPTIMEIHAPAIAPRGGAFLLTWINGAFGPQEVDWYWQTVTGATRPTRSRLLFERQSIPLEPAPGRLSPDDLHNAIEGGVRDSLQMAFTSAKRIQRGDPWATTGQMIHLAACIGKVEWLLEHGTSPVFDDRAGSPLPDTFPVSREDRLGWIGASLQRLRALLKAQLPTTQSNLDEAVQSVERWLGAMDADQRRPEVPPARPGG